MSSPRARLELTHGGRVAQLILAAPKANILDVAMMADLDDLRGSLENRRDLAAIVLTAEGPSFSYGASVEEHLPGQIVDALTGLHRLIRQWLELPAPTIAAVRGQCLGGGLELVLACDLILAETTAQLGCPEIKLGVFPPAASVLLPARLGAGPAVELLLTGTVWSGERAHAAGLVSRVAPDGGLDETLGAWLAEDFVPRSPAALRHGAWAARRALVRALESDLPGVERRYLIELMGEADAVEGIKAFLDKREPRWSLLEETE